MKNIARKIRSQCSNGTWRIILLLAAAITMVGASKSPYGPHDKAAYANQATIDFLRPGLVITINAASIAADGTISTTYTLTDPAGLPLDAAGVYTPGPITVSYIAAVLPANQDQYTAYTTRVQTGAAGTYTNASTDTGGVVTSLGNGQYTYVFGTKAPKGFDATATHTVAVYGRRNMAAFNIPNNAYSTVMTFLPAGGKVTHVRDVLKTASCNTCHDQLSAHGGTRRQVEVCILCHQPQSTDYNTGNPVDFKVMVHKIHMGSQLPSVIAGKPYKISSTDFSTVVYPADPRRCETCHNQNNGATQAANYMGKPTRATCGSCHDDVNFATGANHPGGFQLNDNQCANCHVPKGETDFDASVKGAHVMPEESTLLSGFQFAITKVANTSAGQKPVVTFTMKDNSGAPLDKSKVASISFVMAGPTTDYGYTSFGSDVTTPGYVSETATTAATCGSDGTCLYNFTHAVPSNAKGTYAIAFQASRAETVLAGTNKQQTISEFPMNQVTYFSVDGSAVAARRKVVDIANCNKCHVSLELHGGGRRNTEFCIMCHNPSNTDVARRPGAIDPAQRLLPNQGVNFNLLVHRIHTGDNLPALGASYTVIGFGGTTNDFTDVRYPAMSPTGSPGDTRNCSICHSNASEQALPTGKNNVVDPQGYINPDPPITAACTGCHADKATASHALGNINSLGEACTVCHKAGSEFSVASQHAQY
jgi:OmcA/MtrC family decaheme c-type cytochrome